jgi:hypothetical protein
MENPNEVIDFVIPWSDIERTPVMEDLPIYYTLTHQDFANPQESNRTTIDVLVEVVDLPEPDFPAADFPNNIANCSSLKRKVAGGTEWGIFVHTAPRKATIAAGSRCARSNARSTASTC